jgi:hypothetical protein
MHQPEDPSTEGEGGTDQQQRAPLLVAQDGGHEYTVSGCTPSCSTPIGIRHLSRPRRAPLPLRLATFVRSCSPSSADPYSACRFPVRMANSAEHGELLANVPAKMARARKARLAHRGHSIRHGDGQHVRLTRKRMPVIGSEQSSRERPYGPVTGRDPTDAASGISIPRSGWHPGLGRRDCERTHTNLGIRAHDTTRWCPGPTREAGGIVDQDDSGHGRRQADGADQGNEVPSHGQSDRLRDQDRQGRALPQGRAPGESHGDLPRPGGTPPGTWRSAMRSCGTPQPGSS